MKNGQNGVHVPMDTGLTFDDPDFHMPGGYSETTVNSLSTGVVGTSPVLVSDVEVLGNKLTLLRNTQLSPCVVDRVV